MDGPKPHPERKESNTAGQIQIDSLPIIEKVSPFSISLSTPSKNTGILFFRFI